MWRSCRSCSSTYSVDNVLSYTASPKPLLSFYTPVVTNLLCCLLHCAAGLQLRRLGEVSILLHLFLGPLKLAGQLSSDAVCWPDRLLHPERVRVAAA